MCLQNYSPCKEIMKGKNSLLGLVNYQIKLKYLLKLYNINLIENH